MNKSNHNKYRGSRRGLAAAKKPIQSTWLWVFEEGELIKSSDKELREFLVRKYNENSSILLKIILNKIKREETHHENN
jgi:hypothetical protein